MRTNLVVSLADIYMHLCVSVCGKHGVNTRFRVRNVETLEDYGVFNVAGYGHNGRPLWFKALQLDCFNVETKLRGDVGKYALLSSPSEVEDMSFFHYSYYASLLANSYKEICLASCEVQFGEG